MENEYIYSEEFQSYGDKLKNGLTDYVTLESTLLDDTSVESDNKETPMGCMQEFIDASLVGDKDTAMKKLFAAGVVMANDAGVLPFELTDDSPAGIASMVDDGLTRAKTAYKVATGELTLEEAADTLIDHAAARLVAVTDNLLNKSDQLVDMACNAISSTIPEVSTAAQAAKPFLKQAVKRVVPQIREEIHVGIKKMTQYAKEAARPIIAKAREIGLKIKNSLINFVFG